MNDALSGIGSAPLAKPQTLEELLKRPEVGYGDLARIVGEEGDFSPAEDREIISEVETQITYEGYIAKQENSVKQLRRLESKVIPPIFPMTAWPTFLRKRVKSSRRSGREPWGRLPVLTALRRRIYLSWPFTLKRGDAPAALRSISRLSPRAGNRAAPGG